MNLMNRKRSQSALEFLVGIGVVLIFFTLVIIFFTQRYVAIESSRTESSLETVTQAIQEEIFIAKGFSGNYERNFSLPDTIFGDAVQYSLSNGREISLIVGDVSYLVFLPTYVYGDLTTGTNTVVKRGSLVGICSDNCSLDAVFNSTGLLQCSSFEGAWLPCDLAFDDSYIGIRSVCNGTSLNLTILNIDDNQTVFSDVSTIVDGSYRSFDFSSQPFVINESGYWNVSSKCDSQPRLTNSYYVPYGNLEFEPISVGSCSFNLVNASYNCTEDENFTISGTIQCNGGECGETFVWLDPIAMS